MLNRSRNRIFAFSFLLGLLVALSPAPNLISTPQAVLFSSQAGLRDTAQKVPVISAADAWQPLDRSSLTIQGTQFMLAGRPTLLRGAVVPHFIYQQIVDHPPYFMWVYRHDINQLRAVGANFVVIPWNSGYLEVSGYVENLVAGIEYAKQQGLTVELVLHSRGRNAGTVADPVQIEVVDDRLVADWSNLLRDPAISQRIAANVSLYGPLSEPALQADGKSALGWAQWKPLAQTLIQTIRAGTGRPSAPIALSGVRWASDAMGMLNDPIAEPQVAIELHPYRANADNFPAQVAALRQAGDAVFAGELGCQDPADYIESLLDYLSGNQISFAAYSMISDSHDPRCTMQTANGVFSTLGKVVLRYYAQP